MHTSKEYSSTNYYKIKTYETTKEVKTQIPPIEQKPPSCPPPNIIPLFPHHYSPLPHHYCLLTPNILPVFELCINSFLRSIVSVRFIYVAEGCYSSLNCINFSYSFRYSTMFHPSTTDEQVGAFPPVFFCHYN